MDTFTTTGDLHTSSSNFLVSLTGLFHIPHPLGFLPFLLHLNGWKRWWINTQVNVQGRKSSKTKRKPSHFKTPQFDCSLKGLYYAWKNFVKKKQPFHSLQGVSSFFANVQPHSFVMTDDMLNYTCSHQRAKVLLYSSRFLLTPHMDCYWIT